MRIKTLPAPTAAPELLRRQDAAVCGREYDGNSPISCSPSSTCALAVNSVDGKDHAGCHSAGDVIPTVCIDASTACDSCWKTGTLVCVGNMYCATRFWYPAVTGEFEKPYATSYWCNKRSFLQLSGTYLPSEFGVWNSAPITDPALRQTAGGQLPSNPAASPTSALGGSSSGSGSNQGQNNNPSSAPADASSPLATGAIAGIAVGGGLLLVVAIAAFIFLRRRKKAASASPTNTARPNASRDETLLDRGATALEHYPYPVEKEGVVEAQHQPVPPQEQAHYLSRTSSGHSISGENSDTLAGLPHIDDTRTLRTRGAPSVMTDMSETLTLGGDGEVDDIHAIGHGR
ncbi:hypothetical protein QBC34DRAFT_381240 [Podospora aff. communis PSN243]|uniref:Gram-positive cocci surface proteins LPxTG domain-containing protein n=1 Tax=Podospora aff. communis PSN243 TaxID=3040156 RepID=A0AAV9GHV3_9PEZI|nr:hypothetical protein QBC34DRAFT_381240 [Podospora aff. communis PSN243]